MRRNHASMETIVAWSGLIGSLVLLAAIALG